MSRILAVDDDPGALRYLDGLLSAQHRMVRCPSGGEAIERLAHEEFDLVLVDLSMPPPDGFDVLRFARSRPEPPPVIVISATDRARATLEAVRSGACDYLVKPAAPEEVRAAVARVLESRTGARRMSGSAESFGIVGESPAIRRVRQLVPLLARSPEAVLLVGETGTGKEILARAIHEHGPRRERPLVVHNMAATPTELAESVFFGHVRGAFTGASSDHAGLFERADHGTLFLDEIDSLSLAVQPKLLRALECGKIHRLGSAQERVIDVRVIATTSVDPKQLIHAGRFRADLYYRLSQLEVPLPPLRERPEDVPPLVRHFLAELASEGSRARLSTAAADLLGAHDWPGNVRELRSALRSAALMAGDGEIAPGHLPRSLQSAGARGKPARRLAQVEGDHILRTLEQVGGNLSRAARLLGIDRGTLARRLKSLGRGSITPSDDPDAMR